MPQTLRVKIPGRPGEQEFNRSFQIGRTLESDVCVPDEYVSRRHIEVALENGRWVVRDLASANGLFLNGTRVAGFPLAGTTTIRLGVQGPFVTLEVPAPPAPPPVAPPVAQPVKPKPAANESEIQAAMERYFAAKPNDGPAGDHTVMVRAAFSRVQKKQKRTYRGIVAALALLVVAAGGYAFYLHRQNRERKALAENLFYTMKSLDLDIANVERLVSDSNSKQGQAEILQYRDRRKALEANYDRFLQTLRVYPNLSPRDRLILRVARIFGECELDMPPGFVDEVDRYIKLWQSSGRLKQAIRTARQNGYIPTITKELLAHGLPPQFFYLALQESNFDAFVSGPRTRKGIAKGMWQFIPETAVKYGLRIGPLADLPRPDPGDDRHHYELATKAAAAYLKELYSTDAQASGFLVMACYNWGEDYVLPLVRKMPANPRERNFWRLLATYRDKLPQETYDYVFYIVSAAVIGEDPRQFGFDFDNPL